MSYPNYYNRSGLGEYAPDGPSVVVVRELNTAQDLVDAINGGDGSGYYASYNNNDRAVTIALQNPGAFYVTDPDSDGYYYITLASGDPLIEQVQEALNEFKDSSYAPLAIDGNLGAKTRERLREFQQQSRLPVTGEADDATLRELGFDVQPQTSQPRGGGTQSNNQRNNNTPGTQPKPKTLSEWYKSLSKEEHMALMLVGGFAVVAVIVGVSNK